MNIFLSNIQNTIFYANNCTSTKCNIIMTGPKNFFSDKKPEINQSLVIISKLRYMNEDFYNQDTVTNEFMQQCKMWLQEIHISEYKATIAKQIKVYL